MKFVLSIELGNEAMRTKADLVRAILKVKRSIQREVNLRDKRVGANSGAVLDLNGNTVGRWAVLDE